MEIYRDQSTKRKFCLYRSAFCERNAGINISSIKKRQTCEYYQFLFNTWMSGVVTKSLLKIFTCATIVWFGKQLSSCRKLYKIPKNFCCSKLHSYGISVTYPLGEMWWSAGSSSHMHCCWSHRSYIMWNALCIPGKLVYSLTISWMTLN